METCCQSKQNRLIRKLWVSSPLLTELHSGGLSPSNITTGLVPVRAYPSCKGDSLNCRGSPRPSGHPSFLPSLSNHGLGSSLHQALCEEQDPQMQVRQKTTFKESSFYLGSKSHLHFLGKFSESNGISLRNTKPKAMVFQPRRSKCPGISNSVT